MRMRMRMGRMVLFRLALLMSVLTAPGHGILPEIVDSGISHILEDNPAPGQEDLDRAFVQVEQLPEDPQHKPEDAFHQGCVTTEDCGKGRYCHNEAHKYKCLTCKATDVPCAKDEECCGDQLCVWGQCAQNATKGEAGSTCQYQSDCSPDLCCAFHKALLFPICLAKPIERERCFGASNDLMELLSWDLQSPGPRKHCPCAGDLHCQHLGRGSMCLKGADSSEEDMTDTLYSEIDYII
uniref:Dickkopf WNT signaling pathway inhibitor 3a n=1 Tax=Sphaeramia orbicularis TaxID=375764 RepID=A0A673CPF5_9TELE